MKIPAEFSGRVIKTRLGISNRNSKKVSEIQKEFLGSELDVIYESANAIIVLVFETTEDCLAYKLKYGDDYV